MQTQSPQHILVSGHSGAGKSTVSSELAKKLNMPLLAVDDSPEFKAFLRPDLSKDHLDSKHPEGLAFHELVKRLSRETISNAKEPSVIEGTQLSHLDPAELESFGKRVYVQGNARQILKQRLQRAKANWAEKKKDWTKEVIERKKKLGKSVYQFHDSHVKNYRNMPGTLKYNWRSPGAIDTLVEKLTKQAATLNTSLRQLLAKAELMGSRGRAKMYGRPEPEGRDHDYVVFTDDPQEQARLNTALSSLEPKGFSLKPRPGGFLTAHSPTLDLSYYPTSKRQDIHKAWSLMESGMSKDDAWDQVEREKQANKMPSRRQVLNLLLKAKQHSDRKQYDQKNQIVRDLMRQSPQDWMIDDQKGRYKGVTHRPTNFRLHIDPAFIDSRVNSIEQFAKQAATIVMRKITMRVVLSTPKPQEPEKMSCTKVLQDLLYNCIDATLTFRKCHWNAQGTMFKPLHDFLGEGYDLLDGLVDEIAERLATLDSPADGSAAEVAARSALTALPTKFMQADSIIDELDTRLKTLVDKFEKGISETDDDPVTSNMLQDMTHKLEKYHWMLRRQKEKRQESAKEAAARVLMSFIRV